MKPDPDRHSLISPHVFAAAFIATALFALTCRYPGYVHHDTAEIAMWSRLGWPLGLPKHPPLLPWLFRAYSYVVPLNWVTISLLTAANIVVGAWTVWQIALITLGMRRATLALMLYGLAPAGTFFALKLNHNGILVSLWPLTILAFFLCLQAKTAAKSATYGLLFGALAAASMLAKYYSGVLLVCCFAASLVSAHRNRFYRQPGGYVAVATFAALLAPHSWWMWHSGGATLDYALHESERDAYPLAHFLAVAPTYTLPPVVAFFALQRWLSGSRTRLQTTTTTTSLPELWVLSAGPYLLTAALIAAFKLRGATSWSLPDFCVVPVLLAALLPVPDADLLARLKGVAARALVGLAIAGPVIGFAAFATGDPNATEPRVEFAQAAARIFATATSTQPAIVAGDPQSANAAALDIASHPTVYSNFSAHSAPWVTPERLAHEGLLVICRAKFGNCHEQIAALDSTQMPRSSAFVCGIKRQRIWLGRLGPTASAEITVFPPSKRAITPLAAQTACAAGGDGTHYLRQLR
jgi:4-amino-4-deoxy-L-arabinose transferase-like glycosyltransferase